ncbi:SprT-like domain-containing protein [Bacillus cereus]|uniref:Peptidase n=1 Tax=Bacillus thuringiensis TaxID=1428 RepID=A0A9X6Z4U7_BACTU|nr:MULTISPECIES: SprT-like domain-containing protein [Bacillus cereus group]HDR7922346.1 SprT-like domain-containing protein [Bacillus paranthracis]MCU5283027.1 SprT family zinc-dependent metalloprotease [Bacillus cereus]MDF9599122.1 SprT-like domain-containing protein [Bacillus cereus]MDG1589455.1 SprT-like domain-containing protein [Bacillus cereus]MEC3269812.1 SprT-like domain-containing protein [Bacillus thuringiensis]
MKFSVEELTAIAKDFLQEEYGLPLTINIEISSKMTSTFGVFYVKSVKERVPKVIRLSKNLIIHQEKDIIIDVLKHELVHYACFIQGKPFRDKDTYFKQELARVGSSRTRTYEFKGKVYCYECKKCGETIHARMKGYEKKYVHRNCRGKFKFIGEGIGA